uniref:hypothetical protein n=1 Tax=Mediterraneibacter glycyrrhizinilyticus TaxID=342942 RepID=UPI000AE2AAC4
MVKDGKAYAYAKWCVDENVGYAPVYVKKQCESWMVIADGEIQMHSLMKKHMKKYANC